MEEALSDIAETTIRSITTFEKTGRAVHELSIERLASGLAPPGRRPEEANPRPPTIRRLC